MLQIKFNGNVPAGMTAKIKEVAAEFNLAIEDEETNGEEYVLHLEKSGPTIQTVGEVCTTCEG
jgi:hypothetical protein